MPMMELMVMSMMIALMTVMIALMKLTWIPQQSS